MSKELAQLEKVIASGLKAFYEVGEALQIINLLRLYEDDWSSFEEYVETRWGMTRQRAYQLITACTTYDTLTKSTTVDILPTCEAQIRPLANQYPEFMEVAWTRAVEIAGGNVPTADVVRQAVSEVRELPNLDDKWETYDFSDGVGHRNRIKEIRWLAQGRSKDDSRPILKCININNGKSYAADGYRLHIINTPLSLEDKQGTYHAGFHEDELRLLKSEGEFPIVDDIIPTGTPTFEICLAPGLLADTLTDFGGKAHFKFYAPDKPILITNEDDTKQAVIMPMHMPERT